MGVRHEPPSPASSARSAVMATAVARWSSGRTSAATLGFWLNGRYTFADGQGSRLGWRRFARFWMLWLVMTALSTLLVAMVETRLGLRWAWLAKPVVEAGLAVANFFLMRRLVFR